jgi:hypothetical protein
MARNVGAFVESNFSRGLITQASSLAFPQNAVTETYDCHFGLKGDVYRRSGFNFEFNYATKTINREGAAISTYLWRNVAGDGTLSLWVVQVGGTLYFYNIGNSGTLSQGALATTITLSTYLASGAPSPNTIECQFSDGYGFLFVAHPYLSPFYISFATDTSTATGTAITLKIRDLSGVSEAVAVDNRPTALTTAHKYNLGNQGWRFSSYTPHTSSTSITPGAGSKTFTTTTGSSDFVVGEAVYVWSKGTAQVAFGIGSSTAGNNPHWMKGTVASYNSGTGALEVTVGSYSGTTAKTDWQIGSDRDFLIEFYHATLIYPSNSDVWWMFKNATEQFDPQSLITSVNRGSTSAPKGRYILTLWDQDRDAASGLTGIDNVTTSYFRPSTCCFYTGRVFWSGITYTGYSGAIYFSQISEPGDTSKFGLCYQKNDPGAEDLFDLLPDDGGVIRIPEAGTILKLWPIQNGLLVFATNGIWIITGNDAIGFAATDYTVQQVSKVKTLSNTSFVDVDGYPVFWSADSIYAVTQGKDGVSVQSLTDNSIYEFYKDIPIVSKKQARGVYDFISKKVHWLYRTTASATIEEVYEYDRILIFNKLTSAFNPWTISESDIKLHAVIVGDAAGGAISANQIITNASDTVVDDNGDNVVSFEISSSVIALPVFKYLASYPEASSYEFTIIEERDDETYLDFYDYDSTGVDYTSYFISGHRVDGQAQKKYQANYIYLYSNIIPSEYRFQGMWDFANTGDSGSWSSQSNQTVVNTNVQYDVRKNRLKVRGEGHSLRFKVYSVSGEPFGIAGWSVWETSNASV